VTFAAPPRHDRPAGGLTLTPKISINKGIQRFSRFTTSDAASRHHHGRVRHTVTSTNWLNSVVLWWWESVGSDRIHSKYLRTSGSGYGQDLGVMEVTVR
jgi:hypothetical protein